MDLVSHVRVRTRWLAVHAAIAGMALLAPASVSAQDVPAGFDLWVTPPGQAEHDFSTSPIPADFFYPGSDPFAGFVLLGGFGGLCGGADTIVERLGDANLPTIPSQDTIPIEIIELQLQSIAPIDVTGINPIEQWVLDVTLPPGPQPPGTMTIDQLDAGGGTYDSILPVCPLFIFNRISGPPASVQFDLCLAAFPPVQVQTSGASWTHNVQLPLLCGPPNVPRSSNDFLPLGPHTGPHAPVPLESPAGLPALGAWAIGLLVLLVSGIAVSVFGRRMGARSAT
jgi:hypothetical protein